MFFFNSYFYIFTIVLQVVCILHCLKKGNATYWIWLLIFLPLVGCIVYFFSEILSGREIKNVQSGITEVFNPSGSIKKLEDNLRFSDTFNNRIALADAFLKAGQTKRAIQLYEQSLTGAFSENEYVLVQLVNAYFAEKQYEDVIKIAQKIYKLPQFTRSHTHVLYAQALGYAGKPELAEKEFQQMKTKFANFEARYQYGRFLQRENRTDEAYRLYTDMTEEARHLSSRERKYNREWFFLTREELRKMK